jgi:hypothetical protein
MTPFSPMHWWKLGEAAGGFSETSQARSASMKCLMHDSPGKNTAGERKVAWIRELSFQAAQGLI